MLNLFSKEKNLSSFPNLTKFQKSLVLAIVSVLAYAFSTSLSYSLFASFQSSTSNLVSTLPGPSSTLVEDPKEPKTESCPLNGAMHTKKAKDAWELRRPLAIMIENHTEARPQSGLSSADIVYEAVAEGGITRFMAVFLCNLADTQVGPVRSARTYFLDWVSEYGKKGALYAHVGGANAPGPANALGQIIDYEMLDLNQFSIGFPTFWRDYQRLGHSVATEHTMYSTTQKLWEVASKRGWVATDSAGIRWDTDFTPWKFKEDTSGGTTSQINVSFWDGYGDYGVLWDYDKSCNCYKRKNGGTVHNDFNTNQQLSSKVVIVQFEKESHANDGYEGNVHLLYQTKGQGKVLVFQDGNVVEGTWNKQKRTSRTLYLDKAGKEVSFNRGVIWIQTVPEGSKVTY